MTFFIDIAILGSLIIFITAFNGVILNTLGEKVFGGKERSKFVDQTNKTMTGWNTVGGKGVARNRIY